MPTATFLHLLTIFKVGSILPALLLHTRPCFSRLRFLMVQTSCAGESIVRDREVCHFGCLKGNHHIFSETTSNKTSQIRRKSKRKIIWVGWNKRILFIVGYENQLAFCIPCVLSSMVIRFNFLLLDRSMWLSSNCQLIAC